MINRLLPLLLSAGLALSGVTAAADDDDARMWLDRMSQAVQQRNYMGTFVYLHDGKMETLGVVHRVDADGERERLYSLTGVRREVLRDNESVTCILADRESVVISAAKPRSPFRAGWLKDLDQLATSYDIRVVGRERVVGRLARVVAILPKDIYRYGHRLWLDVETDLMLKSKVLDEQGGTVEQMMFTELKLPDHISDAALEPALSGEGYTWVGEGDSHLNTAKVAGSAWRVMDLPQGFMLKHHNRHQLPASDGMVEHLVYSDGLATVSVYIEAAGGDAEVFDGTSHRGATNAFGTRVAGHQVTAVGEVPPAAVERVARSVQRAE